MSDAPRKFALIAGLWVIIEVAGVHPVSAGSITVGGACNLYAAITAANTDTSVGGCPAGSGEDSIYLTVDVALTNALPSVTSKNCVSSRFSSTMRATSPSTSVCLLPVAP